MNLLRRLEGWLLAGSENLSLSKAISADGGRDGLRMNTVSYTVLAAKEKLRVWK